MTERAETVETVVIGGGQAGLALSRCLTAAGLEHVVLERGAAGERWRSERWDSFRLLSPAWAIGLPGLPRAIDPARTDPDAFLTGRQVLDLLTGYAASFGAPLRTGTEVLALRPEPAGGWRVSTRTGGVPATLRARRVVVATGFLDLPRIPAAAAGLPAGVTSLHSSRYRNPDALPPGAVLVVGAGPSGQQIAAELARAGRDVTLAAGRHRALPRSYRGVDAYRWMRRLGLLTQTLAELPDPAAALRQPNAVLTGGGGDLDLRTLRALGVRVTGRVAAADGPRLTLGGDLPELVAAADTHHARFRARVDDWLGLPAGRAERPAPWTDPGPGTLHLGAHGIRTVVWATGFRRDRSWIRAAGLLGPDGEPRHHRGLSTLPGLSFLGLRWQHHRGSSSLHGVGTDATWLAWQLAGEHELVA